MASTAILAIRIISDASKAARDLQKLSDQTSGWERANKTANEASNKAIVGFGLLGAAVSKYASDAQQASGAVESVFKKQAGDVLALSKAASQSVGLAASEYNELAAILGAQLQNLGVAQEALVGSTDGLIKTGADLAATFGGTTKDAVQALSAVLRGETDPIERYGISIKQAAIQAELAARGQDKLKGKAAQQAKTQAILALVAKQSASAQGQFARESDTAAVANQKAAAAAKDAAAQLGSVLLPFIAALATEAAKLAGFVNDNATAFQITAAVVLGFALAVKAAQLAVVAYKAVMTAITVATIVWRNAQMALNLAMIASPVGVIVAGVLLLVGAIVLAYKRSSTFRAIVQAVMKAVAAAVGWVIAKTKELFGWIGSKLPGAAGVAKTLIVTYFRVMSLPLRTMISLIGSLIGWVRDKAPAAFRAFRDVVRPIVDRLKSAFDRLLSPILAAVQAVKDLIGWIGKIDMPDLGSLGSKLNPLDRRAPGGGGGGDTLQITVNGALDADAVARQIESMLDRRRRRMGVA